MTLRPVARHAARPARRHAADDGVWDLSPRPVRGAHAGRQRFGRGVPQRHGRGFVGVGRDRGRQVRRCAGAARLHRREREPRRAAARRHADNGLPGVHILDGCPMIVPKMFGLPSV
jgi:hypothetical protein